MDVLGHLRLAHRAVKGALDAPESERFGALLNAELALRVAMMLFDHSTARGAVEPDLAGLALAFLHELSRSHTLLDKDEMRAARALERAAKRVPPPTRGAVSDYPRDEGDTTVIGPECFAAKDGSVLNWRGQNYVPQPDPQAGAVDPLMADVLARARGLAEALANCPSDHRIEGVREVAEEIVELLASYQRVVVSGSQRVLVGDSVYEHATVTINDGRLYVEFEADDLDSVTVDLRPLGGV
jgi:hypothetical protein